MRKQTTSPDQSDDRSIASVVQSMSPSWRMRSRSIWEHASMHSMRHQGQLQNERRPRCNHEDSLENISSIEISSEKSCEHDDSQVSIVSGGTSKPLRIQRCEREFGVISRGLCRNPRRKTHFIPGYPYFSKVGYSSIYTTSPGKYWCSIATDSSSRKSIFPFLV